jgi:hypothetical protein
LDTGTLLFFGGSTIRFTPYLRRLLLPLVQGEWPEWIVSYARYGMVDFAQHLGLDSATVLTSNPDIDTLSLEEIRDAVPTTYDIRLVTVMWLDGTVSDYRFPFSARAIASLGPALLEILKLRTPVGFPHEGEETEDGWVVDQGISIDVREKMVWLWDEGELDPRWLEHTRAAWPGWSVAGHIDGIVHQARLTGRDPKPYMLPDAEVARQLVTELGSDNSVDLKALLMAVGNVPEGTNRVEVAQGFFRQDPPPLNPAERKARIEHLLRDMLD